MMIDEKTFNKVVSLVVLAGLVVLTFFIIRPILTSALFALILAFMFHPVYRWVLKYVKNKNLTALLICIVLLLILIIPLIFIVPILIKQIFEIFVYFQGQDFASALRDGLPGLFSSPEIADSLSSAVNSFAGKIASSFLNSLTNLIINAPIIFLRVLLVVFVFFFGLRDGEKLVGYIQSLSPLSKESERRVFKQFKDITHSVIFGQIVVGIVQGIVTGIALFVFQVPNALVLTLLATFVGVLPIIGPTLVWIPVDIYLFLMGRTGAGIGMLIYGLVVISWVDNLIRPLIVSKKTKINSAIILVSMVGGLFVFGILGLIIGPLVIAYLILILEYYRKSKGESLLVQHD